MASLAASGTYVLVRTEHGWVRNANCLPLRSWGTECRLSGNTIGVHIDGSGVLAHGGGAPNAHRYRDFRENGRPSWRLAYRVGLATAIERRGRGCTARPRREAPRLARYADLISRPRSSARRVACEASRRGCALSVAPPWRARVPPAVAIAGVDQTRTVPEALDQRPVKHGWTP